MTTLLEMKSTSLQIGNAIEYPEKGVLSKGMLQDGCCKYTLFCLAAGTEIAEHTATRNATVNVLEGEGTFILEGQEIVLEAGVFIVMPANAPHSLSAKTNLAFILTLSEQPQG